MKKYKDVFKVLKSEYMNCSINGNPKKLLILEDSNGGVHLAQTATDALCGYYSYENNRKYSFTYHFTKTKATMIIDYYEEIKQ